jgi:hypothetical protein
MKLWPKGQVRDIRFHDMRHTYASVLLMLGANLVSVQKLLGHSDPKITERRYGHMLPEFMSAEVNRLRFGLDRLAPAGSASQDFASPRSQLGTIWAQSGTPEAEEAGATRISPSDSGLLAGGMYGTRIRLSSRPDGARRSATDPQVAAARCPTHARQVRRVRSEPVCRRCNPRRSFAPQPRVRPSLPLTEPRSTPSSRSSPAAPRTPRD